MMTFSLIKGFVFGMLGGGIGLCIPTLTITLIEYKCRQKERSFKGSVPIPSIRNALIVFMSITSVLMGLLLPTVQCMFAIPFLAISLIVVLTDYYLRLVANECVVFLLVIGILFRVVTGGISALLGSLAALGIVILFFGISAGAFYMIKKQSGIGAGDLKLAMVMAIIVGYPGVLYFLYGMALAVLVYLLIIAKMSLFHLSNYFPMSAHLCVGFWAAWIIQYVIKTGIII